MRISDEQKGLLFLILIVLILASAGAVVALSMRTDTVAQTLESDQVMRVLYVIDNDNDAMMSEVLIYYPESKKAMIVHIPDNIGHIYGSLGRVDGISAIYRERGIETYKAEIESLLGVTIPFYFVTRLEDFIKIADILGGLSVFIPEAIDITDDSGMRYLLPSGAVSLDGDKVATYLRLNLKDEDASDVYERYQNIAAAYFMQLSEKRAVLQDRAAFKMFTSLSQCNIEGKDLRRLVGMLSEMDAESLIRQSVTGSTRTVDGRKLVFPNDEGQFIRQAIAQATNMLISTGNTMTSRVYVLNILNGTTTQSLARNTAILYQNASYDVLSTSNADRNDYDKTVIIDHIGNEEIAKMVGDFIHCTNIQEEEVKGEAAGNESVADVDFTIILGKDFNGRYVR